MRMAAYAWPAVLLWLAASGVLAPAQAGAPAGQEIYQKRCLPCHGPDGKGNPKMAETLKTEIQDLTIPAVLDKPEGELLKVIADGKGKMPPFGKVLNEQEQRALIGFMKQLAPGAR